MSNLLQLNSAQRASGTPANCIFTLDRPITGSYSLAGAQVPFVLPPVDTTHRSLVVSVGGSESTISLAAEYYTIAAMVAALEVALDAVSNVFTVSVGSADQRLTIARTGTADVILYSRTSRAASTLADTLGLFEDTTITGSSGASVVITSPVSLARTLSLHAVLNNHSEVETTNGTRSTFVVPIEGNSFDIATYRPRDHVKQTVHFPQPTRHLSVRWTDHEGTTVSRIGSWTILLKKN